MALSYVCSIVYVIIRFEKTFENVLSYALFEFYASLTNKTESLLISILDPRNVTNVFVLHKYVLKLETESDFSIGTITLTINWTFNSIIVQKNIHLKLITPNP